MFCDILGRKRLEEISIEERKGEPDYYFFFVSVAHGILGAGVRSTYKYEKTFGRNVQRKPK